MSQPHPDRTARRDAILQAAIRTFAEHGFFASRTRDIAAEAGVAEGTIYLYFESKDDLLLTAFRERVNHFCESVTDLARSPLPFSERLTRFISTQFESIEQDPPLATVLLLESRQSTKFYGGAVRDVLRAYAASVDGLLQSGIDRGELRADLEVPIARRMLIGAIEEVELHWLLGERSRPLSPIAPHVAAIYYNGVRDTPRGA